LRPEADPMSAAMAAVLSAAGFGALFLRNRRVRAIRVLALIASGAAFAIGLAGAAAGQWMPGASALVPREAWMLAVLAGSFFLTFIARGLAAKTESVATLFMMAAGSFAVAAPSLESFFAAVAILWMSAGALTRLRGIDGRAAALRAFGAAAVLSLALGLAALLTERQPVVSQSLRCFAFLCLLGAFPLHFWMPVALPGAPFLLATLVPVLFARVGAAGFVHWAPVEPAAGIMRVLGMIGICWCACAALAANNLREKAAYLLCAQSSLCAWALGKGLFGEAQVLLLATTPAAVLIGIGPSILYDRLKYLDCARVSGIAEHLPRMHFLLAAATLGLLFLPGSVSFMGLQLVLPHAKTAWELWLLTGALLVLLVAGGHTYMSACFGEGNEDLRRAGDLNARELTAAIPLAACVLAGLWPGLARVLRDLL